MNEVILPGARCGSVVVPSSKSQAQRLLIAAALSERPVILLCSSISADIAAAIDCLRALGAAIDCCGRELRISPLPRGSAAGTVLLPVGESGAVLRFLLPVVGALGREAVFLPQGRLPRRPLQPLQSELCRHNMHIAWDGVPGGATDGARLYVGGQLQAGDYALPGDVSSQYGSGLLLALPLLKAESRITVQKPVGSAQYIAMTEAVLAQALVQPPQRSEDDSSLCFRVFPSSCQLPPRLCVEGDWSGASCFLAAGALSHQGVSLRGLCEDSLQGDSAILPLLQQIGAQVNRRTDCITVRRGELCPFTVDAEAIPDLIPALAVLAAGCVGESRIVNAARLRLKESDRLHSLYIMLHELGGEVEELPDGLRIVGSGSLRGGRVGVSGDHRIAMAAAAAAVLCREPVDICGSECVAKSYPHFFTHFQALTRE